MELQFLEVICLQFFSIPSAKSSTIAPSFLAGFNPIIEFVRTVHWVIDRLHQKPSRRNTSDSHCGWYNYSGQVTLLCDRLQRLWKYQSRRGCGSKERDRSQWVHSQSSCCGLG